MKKEKSLAVLVSANGFGHIRRQISIVSELLNRHPNLIVTFALTAKQNRRFKSEIELLGPTVEVIGGVTEESVLWRQNAYEYSDSNLNGWENRWRSNLRLINSDFIISDNLVGVLAERPDGVLSGSFLWHEVISAYSLSNESCKKFVARDLSLLLANKPKMICNKYIASKAVLELTSPVAVSWMVDRKIEPFEFGQRNSILVHGGGTRTIDRQVSEVAQKLRLSGFKVFTDIEDDENVFDYSNEAWGSLGVVVCRPGAGTATECVKWKIPMIVIRDPQNSEAEFIAERLSSLGLAHGFSDGLSSSDLAGLAEDVISGGRTSYYLKPFETCIGNGITEAVDYLESHWKLNECHL